MVLNFFQNIYSLVRLETLLIDKAIYIDGYQSFKILVAEFPIKSTKLIVNPSNFV